MSRGSAIHFNGLDDITFYGPIVILVLGFIIAVVGIWNPLGWSLLASLFAFCFGVIVSVIGLAVLLWEFGVLSYFFNR